MITLVVLTLTYQFFGTPVTQQFNEPGINQCIVEAQAFLNTDDINISHKQAFCSTTVLNFDDNK